MFILFLTCINPTQLSFLKLQITFVEINEITCWQKAACKNKQKGCPGKHTHVPLFQLTHESILKHTWINKTLGIMCLALFVCIFFFVSTTAVITQKNHVTFQYWCFLFMYTVLLEGHRITGTCLCQSRNKTNHKFGGFFPSLQSNLWIFYIFEKVIKRGTFQKLTQNISSAQNAVLGWFFFW